MGSVSLVKEKVDLEISRKNSFSVIFDKYGVTIGYKANSLYPYLFVINILLFCLKRI